MSPPESPGADDWDAHWGSYESAARSNPAVSYRKTLILSALQGCSPPARVVDIGSGLGELAVLMAETFPEAEVRGLEYSAAGVESARAMAAGVGLGARVSFSQKDLLQPLDLSDAERHWATVALCSEVLEHVDAPEILLGNALEYLAPTCRVVVTVPGGPRTAFDKHIGHRKHFTERSLRELLAGSGFEVLEVQRAGFPFFDLYKLVVLLRGKALIQEFDEGGSAPPSRLASAMLRFFDRAFRWNVASNRFGWQLVAVAQPKPAR
jgi:SAM-dependent methyltransferase